MTEAIATPAKPALGGFAKWGRRTCTDYLRDHGVPAPWPADLGALRALCKAEHVRSSLPLGDVADGPTAVLHTAAPAGAVIPEGPVSILPARSNAIVAAGDDLAAYLQADEDTCTLDCGCILRRDPDGQGGIQYFDCAMHSNAAELLRVVGEALKLLGGNDMGNTATAYALRSVLQAVTGAPVGVADDPAPVDPDKLAAFNTMQQPVED